MQASNHRLHSPAFALLVSRLRKVGAIANGVLSVRLFNVVQGYANHAILNRSLQFETRQIFRPESTIAVA
eukprot:3116761-Amphidinium_carterae.1